MNIETVKGKEQGDAIKDLEATVKSCLNELFKNEGDDGVSYTQVGTLQDDTGEINFKWVDTGGQKVRRGDRVKISARPGAKGTRLRGASLGEYKDEPQVVVYGDKLEIVGGAEPPKTKQEAATRAQAPGKSHSFRTMTESQARLFIWRQMNEFAKLCRFDFGELSDLPAAIFVPLKEIANTLFIAWQKGEISPDLPEDPALEFPPREERMDAGEAGTAIRRVQEVFGRPEEEDPYAV